MVIKCLSAPCYADPCKFKLTLSCTQVLVVERLGAGQYKRCYQDKPGAPMQPLADIARTKSMEIWQLNRLIRERAMAQSAHLANSSVSATASDSNRGADRSEGDASGGRKEGARGGEQASASQADGSAGERDRAAPVAAGEAAAGEMVAAMPEKWRGLFDDDDWAEKVLREDLDCDVGKPTGITHIHGEEWVVVLVGLLACMCRLMRKPVCDNVIPEWWWWWWWWWWCLVMVVAVMVAAAAAVAV